MLRTRAFGLAQRIAAAGIVVMLAAMFGCKAETSEDPANKEERIQAEESNKTLESTKEKDPDAKASGDITLRLLKHALVLVKTKYYDPTRVDWRKMTAHGIDALQAQLAEVVAEFDEPLENNPQTVKLRINTVHRSFDLSGIKELGDAHVVSVEVLTFVRKALQEERKLDELEYTMINGMLDTLDPHSVLLTPRVYEDMQTSHGGFGGLGIVIGIRDDALTVISPIEGTPASRAGLKASDKITEIGQESTINMPLHEAVQRLRGKVGTPAEIMVMRKNWTEARKFTIVRDEIKIRSLITQALETEKIGYIKIKSFEKNTGDDVRKHLQTMREEMGGLNGLILDLRFNAGGLLSQAIKVTDTFLPEGKVIVVQEGPDGSEREEALSTAKVAETDFPIVVIMNAGSASASEIVAGALKNHDRAVLIGDQTFGKGSVQILRDNDDGSAIKLTIAQYLTPGDISIQGVGIPPDIRVVPVVVSEEEGVDLFVSENIRREGLLDLALQSEKVRAADEPVAVIRYLWEENEEEAVEEGYSEDFEIILAKKMIAVSKDPERGAMIKATHSLMEGYEEVETKKIGNALAKFDVDWVAGAEKPQPFDVGIELLDQDGKTADAFDGGEKMRMRATVTNKGDAPIHRLFAISHSNNPVYDDRELLFGKLEPGESRTWDLDITIPRGVETRRDPVSLSFGDVNGKLEQTATTAVEVHALETPHFAYSYQVVDHESGNGDGLLQKDESVELLVHVRNMGPGDSTESMVIMRNESGSAMYLARGRVTLGQIKVGEVKTARLKFEVNGKRPKTDDLEFELTILDKEFGARLDEVVQIPVQPRGSQVQGAKGAATVRSEVPVYAGMELTTAVVARAKAGDRVERQAVSSDGSLTRVGWVRDEQQMVGWIPTGSLETDSAGETTSPLEVVTTRTAPQISVAETKLMSDAESIEVSGVIRDDTKVEDYRIYLWHRDGTKTHAQKLDYGLGGRTEKEFAVSVPLRIGVNRVTIVARDDQKLENSQTIYVAK